MRKKSLIVKLRNIKQQMTPFTFCVLTILLCSLLMYSPDVIELQEENQLLPMIVPCFIIGGSLKVYIISIFIFFLFIYCLTHNGALKRDVFLSFLILRLALGVIMIPIVSAAGGVLRLGNYYLFLLELFFYWGCLTSTNDDTEELLVRIFKYFVFLVAMETIYQSVFGIMNQVPYISSWYKANMNTPAGSSNTLSAIILPVMMATVYQKQKNIFDRTLIFICIAAIILTKSRWGMSIMICGFILYYFKTKMTPLKLLLGVSLLVILGYLIISYWDVLKIVIWGFGDEVSGSTIDKVTSGRTLNNKYYFDTIINYPIIGYGPNYLEGRAHNIVLDVLFQSGVVGFTLFVVSIMTIINTYRRKVRNYGINGNSLFYYIIVMVVLIQSLGEISFFTDIICDVIFLSSLAVISRKNSIVSRIHKDVKYLSTIR